MRLDDDARLLFDEARREWMEVTREASGLTAGWAGKNPGRLLRLALVFDLLAWAARAGDKHSTISADAIARAAAYLDYAARMLDRVMAGVAMTEADADAAKIARHLLAKCPATLNERSLYQTQGFAWARDTESRTAALAVLEREHWIRRPNAQGKGRPRGDWEVSPRLVEAPR
jgi:hypothetical protein